MRGAQAARDAAYREVREDRVAQRNEADGRPAKPKPISESLILAQDERWRRA